MDTVNQIYNIIKDRLLSIKNGYEIIPDSYEADGCDQYGVKYWVTCKNGFSCRSWNVNKNLNLDVWKYFKYIYEYGIYLNDNVYFIKDILVNDLFPIDVIRLEPKDIVIIDKNELDDRKIESIQLKLIIPKIKKIYSSFNPYPVYGINWIRIKTFETLKVIVNNQIKKFYFDKILEQLKLPFYIGKKLEPEKYAAIKIQQAWRLCRYNPKYKMCESVQIHNLEEICNTVKN